MNEMDEELRWDGGGMDDTEETDEATTMGGDERHGEICGIEHGNLSFSPARLPPSLDVYPSIHPSSIHPSPFPMWRYYTRLPSTLACLFPFFFLYPSSNGLLPT
ncbi:hypothetical protein JDV02_001725 [Purpureocillium takamizusanense]|uniref:Uncharacterized protein n=1 Tax=Purpureocillium takamizusanense TaxID=2060973 RepID=A0A9Q8Q9G6_9HYPO|nr:uncharacterized protein JDV02_001725 [Purpureocillium takamizusanense]UNI15162.1 hypothetical protein JDV02_001725 [Purpureocillium takamizusanense]